MDCARNIITANFSGGGTSATTAPLWQWDYGQALCITGIEDLPAAFEVHFSTNRTGGVSTTAVGADGQVTIPNVLLTIGKNLNAWIYLSDSEGEGETEYSILIPVKARPMPETYDAEVSGEFDDVVRQVSEYAETAQAAADNAGASASAAEASASEAAASATAAEAAKTAAETAQGKAEDAQAAAETAAQTATEKAQQTAQDAAQAAQSKADAESAAQSAEAAQTGAESAKMDAETAAQDAADSASAASASATSAGQAASAAAQSATEAAQSAASIEGDVQIASQKAAEAQTAAGQAVAAKDAAVTAQTAAETAASTAAANATTASTKAAEAAQSASSAAQSKTDAEAAATRAEQAAASLTVDSALSDTSVNPVQNKVVTGAITDVKSAIDALKITDTASGAIASFPDGAAMPVESLTVEMNPIQDLHGYDSPWPAGGGKNVLPYYDADITQNGITLKVNSDYSVTLNGTATATMTFNAPVGDFEWDGETPYWISGCPTGGNYNAGYSLRIDGVNHAYSLPDIGNGAKLQQYNSGSAALSGTKLFFCIVIRSGTVCSNLTFKPILNAGSSAEPFQPYENICPITGRDSVTVTRSGKNIFPLEIDINDSIYSHSYPIANYSVLTEFLHNLMRLKGQTVTLSAKTTGTASGAAIGQLRLSSGGTLIQSFNPGTPVAVADKDFTSATHMIIYGSTSGATIKDMQIELGSTASDYEPYDATSVTVQLGQTVYGGNAEIISGQGESDYAIATFTGAASEAWSLYQTYPHHFQINVSPGNAKNNGVEINAISNAYPGRAGMSNNTSGVLYGVFSADGNRIRIKDVDCSTVEEFKAKLQSIPGGLQVCYVLATPQTLTLTPAQLSTLKGQNNVWSDGDSVDVTYIADQKLYIDKKITAAVAALA